MNDRFEIVVVGAGLAGASAAALLARHAGMAPASIALLTPQVPPSRPVDAAAELRVVALSRASEHVLQAAQAWAQINQARLCAYERVRVWHETTPADSDASLKFDAADIGEPNLGTVAENSVVTRASYDSFIAAGGSHINAGLEALQFDPQQVRLRCSDGTEVLTRLVVGADGAQSQVRTQAGLSIKSRDYQQLAIVATVQTARPHDRTAWQRFLRTGPLALLPLFDGHSSIVWSLDHAIAQQMLNLSDTDFNDQLQIASDEVLGTITLASERLSFPLHSVRAQSYVAARCALIGDAAHVVHPLAGQGANLGLLDAAALCEAVAAARALREDPGALRVLRRYEQQRRTHNMIMDAAMNVFQAGFAASVGPGAWLVNSGLRAVNRSAALKRAFARQALGLSGDLPRVARVRA